MKFGVREICDVVFKAKSSGNLGAYRYEAGQPVLYIDSAKTSTVEGASSTVYAQGGRGNARLIAWEGEKTLTFTVEDALLSPVGFAILSGAQILKPTTEKTTTPVHRTSMAIMSLEGDEGDEGNQNFVINLSEALSDGEEISENCPIFVMEANGDYSLTGRMFYGFQKDDKKLTVGNGDLKERGATADNQWAEVTDITKVNVLVDYYVEKDIANVHELTIDAGHFAGNWYVEASTLFKRQEDGVDLPAEIVFPNVKIQSNFTFNMASTGDPSTFTFTMDALPGKVLGAGERVLCSIQIVEDTPISIAEGMDSDSIVD